MPAATIRASWYGGAATEPIGATAETGVSLDRSDIQVGTEPLPVPTTSPRTSYSALKQIALEVLSPPSSPTTLVNGTVRSSATMPTGAAWMFRSNATYVTQLSSVSSLSAAVAGGATAVSALFAYPINSFVQIDTSPNGEVRQVMAVSGSGPYTLTLDRILSYSHASGAQIAQYLSAGPPDVSLETSGQPQVPAGYTLPTTAPAIYSTLGMGTSATGRVGPFVDVIGAISSAFGTVPGTVVLPNLVLSYDEF